MPQLTDNLESIKKLSDYLDTFTNVEKIELLAFHKMGEYKWQELGLDYKLADTKEPSKELMQQAIDILSTNGKIVSTNT